MAKAVFRASLRGARRTGYKLTTAGARLQRILLDEMGHGGLASELTQTFRMFAPHRTGRLERNIRALVSSRGARVVVELESTARSDEGFPYTQATRTGRRAVRPVRARVLRFVVGGRVVFTNYVRPYRPARDWAADAARASEAAMSTTSGRVGRRIDSVLA